MAAKQDQMTGDGFDRPTIKEIETAAEEYVKVRDRRMKLTELEVTAKTNLLNAVKKHVDKLAVNADGDRLYRYDDEVVILKPGKENVKVRHAAEPEEQGEE